MRMILKKNILNVFMLISFLLIINYHFTGNIVHEILGLVILLFSLVHNKWNIYWYKYFLKVKEKNESIISIIVNFWVIILLVVAIGSGLFISQTVLPIRVFHNMNFILLMHDVHQGSGYAVYMLVAIHFGMHWNMLWHKMKKIFQIEHYKYCCLVIGNILAIAIIINGINTSFTNHIGSKLLMQHDFISWSKTTSGIQSFIDYFSIFGCYTAITAYIKGFLHFINYDFFHKRIDKE